MCGVLDRFYLDLVAAKLNEDDFVPFAALRLDTPSQLEAEDIDIELDAPLEICRDKLNVVNLLKNSTPRFYIAKINIELSLKMLGQIYVKIKKETTKESNCARHRDVCPAMRTIV